jgi:hypothetical protein
VFEELDAPGEWFDDRREGWLYFKPQSAARPPTLGFCAGAHEALIRVEGRAAQANHVRIRKLRFQDVRIEAGERQQGHDLQRPGPGHHPKPARRFGQPRPARDIGRTEVRRDRDRRSEPTR